jgi:hypothetical protein
MLATSMVNGRLLLCGQGWEGHARLAAYWAAAHMAPQALAHIDDVLAADSSQAELRDVRARLVELIRNGGLPPSGGPR